MSQNKKWSNISHLKKIHNPSSSGYEIKIKNPEVTFLGVRNQPDFANVFITIYPGNNVVELKSLKIYFQQFRDSVISYERLINTVYDDLMSFYSPERLRLVMIFNPRGGISSQITIDSDWKIRGGSEKFKDWVGKSDTW